MKHGVVVASPRAGITRDKYSANKSSHHPPRRFRPSSPFFLPLLPRYLQNVARGWSARPPAIFNKSSRVPTMASERACQGVGQRQEHIRCIRRAFYFVPRARARIFCSLFLSPILFFRFPFFALVLRYRSIFFAFFGRRWIARQLPIRIIWQEIPRAPVTVRHLCPRRPRRHSTSHFCFPSSLLRPGVSAAAIAIRSLTNLFDKSPRLIGLTTRPRLFFPSAKFTVVTRLLVASPFLPQAFCLLPSKFLRRSLVPPFSSTFVLSFFGFLRQFLWFVARFAN